MSHHNPLAHPAGRTIARGARTLIGLAAAACTWAAQAVPVTVAVDGLPPGLSPVLTVQRNVCPDGMGWASNPSQNLSEQSFTVFDRVLLPSGQFTFRSRVVTRYVASFDTPATPVQGGAAWDVRCSAVGIAPDLFRFGIRVPGLDARDRPAVQSGFLAETPQSATVSVNATLAARTTAFTPTLGSLARGMVHTLDTGHNASLGAVTAQHIDFLRPLALLPGSFTRAARIFVRADGVGCVQAGTTTRCLGEPNLAEAGGVLLRGVQRNVPGQPGVVRFQFELMHSFPVGTLKLRAAADATDLAAYLVDGTPQALDLLPWQALEQTVTVQ